MTPTVSVLVCTKDRSESLAVTVASILSDPDPALELLIVDQSTDGLTASTLDALREDRLRYFKSSTRGKGAAINEGLGHARAPLVALTDDDCTVPQGWAREIVRPLVEDERVALVFSRVEASAYDHSSGYIPANFFE